VSILCPVGERIANGSAALDDHFLVTCRKNIYASDRTLLIVLSEGSIRESRVTIFVSLASIEEAQRSNNERLVSRMLPSAVNGGASGREKREERGREKERERERERERESENKRGERGNEVKRRRG